jgi:hypothetical protein
MTLVPAERLFVCCRSVAAKDIMVTSIEEREMREKRERESRRICASRSF